MDNLSRKEIIYGFCITLMVASLIVSNTTASKMYDLYLWDLHVLVPVGTSLFCFSFLSTDIISEIWGRNHAILVAILGLFARIIAIGFYMIAIHIDGTDTWMNQAAYETVLGASSRVLLAGCCAFFVASILDAYIYHYFREKHKDRNLLFLRNNISTFSAHLIGAIIFSTVAFYGIIPNDKIMIIIAGNLLIKWLVALVDTPLVYILRNIATKRSLLDFKG